MAGEGLTPLMAQYFDIKQKHADAILLYRLGDFFETFFEDAVVVARELNLTLTARDKHKDQPVPLAGFPHHAAMNYIARLVAKGHKVAICEQMEDPKLAKGIVKRDVVRIITPGTVFEPDLLDESSNNWLAAYGEKAGRFVLTAADLSTGEVILTEGECGAGAPLAEEFLRLGAREVLLLAGGADELPRSALGPAAVHERKIDDEEAVSVVSAIYAREARARLLAWPPLRLQVVGVLMAFLADTQRTSLSHLRWPREYRLGDGMVLDESTLRNLELLPAGRDRVLGGSLFELLNRTTTPMGARQLKRWLLQPLIDVAAIGARQGLVAALVDDPLLSAELRTLLGGINDLERLSSRVMLGGRNPRDAAALVAGLERVPGLQNRLRDTPLAAVGAELVPLPELVEAGRKTLRAELPNTILEGGVIADGVDSDLDELRVLQRDGSEWLQRFEEAQREATGLRTLKVRHNSVLGYYIEISKSQAAQAPVSYVRKQTLTNGERFITAELKDFETRVFSARDRAIALEKSIYEKLIARFGEHLAAIQADATALARLDALVSLAEVARERGFCRPVISIRGGRHPVVERFLDQGSFVPNDLELDATGRALAVITGPNMAGKSTYLRQAALIILLAQIGSYVPAEAATIGVADRIFTRVGANDNLVRGQSTFMVEMTETAGILAQATARSFLILDEIGRGTSTFDGLALAWAIIEHLHDRVHARTLFATHYHELTDLAELRSGVFNLNSAVAHGGADNHDLVFLHKVVEGPASKSYGIEVARLAGLPGPVLDRAREVLFELERKEQDEVRRFARAAAPPPVEMPVRPQQLSLFSSDDAVIEAIRSIDIARLTPLEALNLIAKLQEQVGGR